MGGEGKFVEADETYVGGKAKNRAYAKKLPRHEPVVALVERQGRVTSFHVPVVNATNMKPIIKEQISAKSHLRTDESAIYLEPGKALPATRPSTIPPRNMFAVMPTLIPSKVIFRS